MFVHDTYKGFLFPHVSGTLLPIKDLFIYLFSFFLVLGFEFLNA